MHPLIRYSGTLLQSSHHPHPFFLLLPLLLCPHSPSILSNPFPCFLILQAHHPYFIFPIWSPTFFTSRSLTLVRKYVVKKKEPPIRAEKNKNSKRPRARTAHLRFFDLDLSHLSQRISITQTEVRDTRYHIHNLIKIQLSYPLGIYTPTPPIPLMTASTKVQDQNTHTPPLRILRSARSRQLTNRSLQCR